MLIKNVSSRSLALRDSSGNQYTVAPYSDTTVSDTLWNDNEFRRWVRYRIRDISIVDTSGTVAVSAVIDTGDPSTVPLTIKGASGQAVDLLQLKDHSNNLLATVTDQGWIGIGVEPLTPLHAEGPISSNGGQIRIDANASNTNAALSFYPNRAGSLFESSRIVATYNGANQGRLAIYTNDGSGTLLQRGVFDELGNLSLMKTFTAENSLTTQMLVGSISGSAGIAGGSASDVTFSRDTGPKWTSNVVVNATGLQISGTALAASHLSNGITGTGAVVLATGPTVSAITVTGQIAAALGNFAAIDIASVPLAASHLSNGVIGTGAVVLAASPTFTGHPVGVTESAGNNSTRLATTAYADGAVSTLSSSVTSSLALKAPLASPTFTGTPAAPTQAGYDNSTKIATTSYVDNQALQAIVDQSNSVQTSVVSTSLEYTACHVTIGPGTWEIRACATVMSTDVPDEKQLFLFDTTTGIEIPQSRGAVPSCTAINVSEFHQCEAFYQVASGSKTIHIVAVQSGNSTIQMGIAGLSGNIGATNKIWARRLSVS